MKYLIIGILLIITIPLEIIATLVTLGLYAVIIETANEEYLSKSLISLLK